MRLRITVLACALTALAPAAVPSFASAAPHHNRGLTIHAVPHVILAGDPVLIYGRLKGPGHGGQTIRLYHRINPAPFFTLVGTTTTNSAGQYEFIRADGVVETNRNWFVRGPGLTHSKTVHELVSPEITLSPSSSTGTTRHPIVFSGHVTPNHAGERVLLQAENGTGDDWHTLTHGRIGADSNYQIAYAWRTAGARDVRVLFPGDDRNIAGVSDPATIVINQAQRPDFTINTSNPIVANNAPYTISGTLYKAGSTTPEPLTAVSLWARQPDKGPFSVVANSVTNASGGYSFTLSSTANRLYQARTTFAPARASAVLFEGVQDQVTMGSSSSTSTVGGHVTFSGSVAPDKAGHVIYLQRLGKDDDWHTVKVGYVSKGSTFSFGWTFGTAGNKEFRARITGGPVNVGAASPPITVAVTQPPVSSLPTG